MTIRSVRLMAKEFAGQFYEQNQRSLRFRRTWPDQQVYCAKNWQHFVDMARAAMGALLSRPDFPEHLKEAIYRDLLEENERQRDDPNAQSVIQAEFDFKDSYEKRSLDSDEMRRKLPGVSG